MIKFSKVNAFHKAKADCCIFRRWEKKELSTEEACHLMAENNGLDYVIESDFITTAHDLGYFRK